MTALANPHALCERSRRSPAAGQECASFGVSGPAGTGCGAVAQLGERLVRNEEVWGSIPHGSTTRQVTTPARILKENAGPERAPGPALAKARPAPAEAGGKTRFPARNRHRKCATVPLATIDSLTGGLVSRMRRNAKLHKGVYGIAREDGRERPDVLRGLCGAVHRWSDRSNGGLLKRSRREAGTRANQRQSDSTRSPHHHKQQAGPSCPTKT
jgi:hypothetical protein